MMKLAAVLTGLFLLAPSMASTEPISVSGTLPTVGAFVGDEKARGDLWPVRCSAGQTLTIRVDTGDDMNLESDGVGPGVSRLDPVVFLLDSNGEMVAGGDDDFECTHPPSCGFSCPEIVYTCDSENSQFYIEARGFGNASTRPDDPAIPEMPCIGGNYTLTVDKKGREGQDLSFKTLGLGVPLAKLVPESFDDLMDTRRPLIDDQAVPFGRKLEKP